MPTHSIGTGKDYTSLVTWEANEPYDCVTNTADAIAEIYGTVADTSALSFVTGWTTNSSYGIIIRAATGQEVDFSDGTGARYTNTTGFAINPGSEFVRFEKLAIAQSGTSNPLFYFPTGAENLSLYRCLVEDPDAAAGTLLNPGTKALLIELCFIHKYNSGTSHYPVKGTQTTVRNSVLVNDNGIGITLYDAYAYNTVAFCTAGSQTYATFFSSEGGDYNAANDTSAPGANSVDSITTSEFANAAAEDWHLSGTGSSLYEAGDDLSAYYTEDADGDTWGSTYSIGFDEPAAAGGGVEVTPTGVSATGSVGTLIVAAAINVTVGLTGVGSTGSAGTLGVTASIQITEELTGVSSTGAAGTLDVSTDGSVSVPFTGVEGTGEVGDLGVVASENISETLTGVGSTGGVGDLSVVIGTNVALTGVTSTGAAGTLGIASEQNIIQALTGVGSTGSVGTLTITVPETVSEELTGVGATGSAGTLTVSGAGMIWTEIPPVTTIWTEI